LTEAAVLCHAARRGAPEGMSSRWYRAALLVCGVALFSYLIVRVGPGAVLASFEALSWRLVVVAVFPCVVVKAFDTLGWVFAFPTDRVPFMRLATTLLAGQAITMTTPTGTLGGDAVKAWMLRDRVSLPESLSSLIIFKTTTTASQGLFLLLGIVIARWTIAPDATLIRAMEWLLVLETIGVVGFVAAQMLGVMAGGHRVLERFGFAGRGNLGPAARHVDQALRTYYRRQPDRLVLSLVFNFLAWIAGIGEAWLILYFLGQPVSLTTALVIEALGAGIAFATFFVPAQVGFAEGGAVATFLALGLDGSVGLTFSLVRRVRDLTWIGLGLVLLIGKPMPSAAALRAQAA
jgi:glycosyltransferase 2 family protein